MAVESKYKVGDQFELLLRGHYFSLTVQRITPSGRLVCNLGVTLLPNLRMFNNADGGFAKPLDIPKREKYVELLRDALSQCLQHIEADEAAHGRPFNAGNVAREALATTLS
jgi:hypothetical protein